MTGTDLHGLDGSNPLGFLAALGVQALFDDTLEHPRLWWSDTLIPHATVDASFTIERIIQQGLSERDAWRQSTALTFPGGDGQPIDEVKLDRPTLRAYLEACAGDWRSLALASALVAEGSMAGKDEDKDGGGRLVAKPTDLHFTAGQQRFLNIARIVLDTVDADLLHAALLGHPQPRGSKVTLGWDPAEDRQHALTGIRPSDDPKQTNPGAEYLALLGLTRYPVFKGRNRTLTTACSGRWSSTTFTWPIWTRPAGPGAVRTLVAHTRPDHPPPHGSGIQAILTAVIDRNRKGQGYGMFSPPEIAWHATTPLPA